MVRMLCVEADYSRIYIYIYIYIYIIVVLNRVCIFTYCSVCIRLCTCKYGHTVSIIVNVYLSPNRHDTTTVAGIGIKTERSCLKLILIYICLQQLGFECGLGVYIQSALGCGV